MKGFRAWYWRAGARAAGTLLRLVPRGWRYPLAFRAAMVAAPLLRRTRLYTERLSLHDGPREESLRLFLRAMIKLGVTFDPVVDVDGAEHVPAGGVLFASGHFMLVILLIRWLHDRGAKPAVVRWNPRDVPMAGTTVPTDLLPNEPNVFLRVRSRLAAGQAVLVLPDYTRPVGNATEIEGLHGRSFLVDSVFRFAARTATPLRFASVRIDGGRARITIRRPSAEDAETMTREFCAFYVAEAEAVSRTVQSSVRVRRE